MTTNTLAKQIYDIYNLGMDAEDIKEILETVIDGKIGNKALYKLQENTIADIEFVLDEILNCQENYPNTKLDINNTP